MSFNKYLCVKKWAGIFLVFCIIANAEVNKQSSYKKINTEASVEKMFIDDFSSDSRNSAFGTKWSLITDRSIDSINTGKMDFVEHDGCQCLHMVRSALHKSNGGLVQARLNLHPKAKYFDAHEFEGVQLQAKGNGQTYAIYLRTADTRLPRQFYQAQFSTNGGWQGIKIPFERFRPNSLSKPLDITKLKSLAIVAIREQFNADIFLDEIAFYKGQLMYKKLTTQEEWVIVHKGTEQPFSGKYNSHFEKGVYTCKRCGAELFDSSSKFVSSCGWPSFDDRLEGAVKWQPDADGVRTEIVCAKCGAHLGHVFLGEGFTTQNTRYCVNSVSLDFIPAQGPPVERAIFASGCFWGTEYHLQRAAGVISTTVGYTAGHVEDPNYEQVCMDKTGHAEALRELTKVRDWLMSISDAAAASLEEGFEELLTVNKLKLPASLKKLFSSTNMIESCYSVAGDLCRNVKRWRGEGMAKRWAGAMLLETEKRFYRIRGYREMPMLAVILKRIVDTKEAVA